MAPTCSVCTHKKRQKIEAALLRGESIRDVAGRYSLSSSAVHRHKQEHLRTEAIAKHLEQEVHSADMLLDMWATARARFERIADDAQRAKDRKGETAAVREQIRLMDLAVRSASEFRAANTANAPLHEHADWPTVLAVLLSTLNEHPKALAAVRNALVEITTEAAV